MSLQRELESAKVDIETERAQTIVVREELNSKIQLQESMESEIQTLKQELSKTNQALKEKSEQLETQSASLTEAQGASQSKDKVCTFYKHMLP